MKKKSSKKNLRKNEEATNKPIEKRYNKDSTNCKVTFRLPKEAVGYASDVYLMGEFNNWNHTPLQKLKNGEFKVTLDLEPGKEYKFRYLIDGKKWENHWNADKYVPNAYGTEDSVVML